MHNMTCHRLAVNQFSSVTNIN